jgi:hypothetical protein
MLYASALTCPLSETTDICVDGRSGDGGCVGGLLSEPLALCPYGCWW